MKKTPPSKPRKVKEATIEYAVRKIKVNSAVVRERIPFDPKKIAAFCKRWKISEFSFFGSVLREDFRPDSDVDVLVSFEPNAGWSLFDLVSMQEELEVMFKRKVDLVEKEAIRNPYRRHAILAGREIIHAIN
ncbi:MAG: DNA polymerase subunit beta [Anaerolineaceae bacterium]|jgi:predicted nucleotidyltransferase|nr:MAG: DNA polymerase subunit beta [Anaerolineaceae bacterium]